MTARRALTTFVGVALAGAGLLALAGCGGNAAETTALSCPDISILADAQNQIAFKPGVGSDLTDVMLAVSIADFRGDCSMARNRRNVTVALEVRFAVERGPASTSPNGSFEYFVAVARKSGEVLAKQRFKTDYALPEGKRRATVVEEIEHVIPLAQGELGESYRIILGMQLTAEQLEFNRKLRGG